MSRLLALFAFLALSVLILACAVPSVTAEGVSSAAAATLLASAQATVADAQNLLAQAAAAPFHDEEDQMNGAFLEIETEVGTIDEEEFEPTFAETTAMVDEAIDFEAALEQEAGAADEDAALFLEMETEFGLTSVDDEMESALGLDQEETSDALFMETFAELDAEMDAELEADAEAEADADTDAESESESELEALADSDAEADVEVDTEATVDSEAGSVTVADTEADHAQDADPIVTEQMETDQAIHDLGLVEADAEAETETEVEAETATDAEAETETDADAEAELDAEAEVEAEHDLASEVDALEGDKLAIQAKEDGVATTGCGKKIIWEKHHDDAAAVAAEPTSTLADI